VRPYLLLAPPKVSTASGPEGGRMWFRGCYKEQSACASQPETDVIELWYDSSRFVSVPVEDGLSRRRCALSSEPFSTGAQGFQARAATGWLAGWD
jgi:hypothetical protein